MRRRVDRLPDQQDCNACRALRLNISCQLRRHLHQVETFGEQPRVAPPSGPDVEVGLVRRHILVRGAVVGVQFASTMLSIRRRILAVLIVALTNATVVACGSAGPIGSPGPARASAIPRSLLGPYRLHPVAGVRHHSWPHDQPSRPRA